MIRTRQLAADTILALPSGPSIAVLLLASLSSNPEQGYYDQALAEAQKIDTPDLFWNHVLLATIYGALGRKVEAAPAIASLLKLYPDIPPKVRAEFRRWNISDEVIDRVIGDLRRAGLNIPPGT